MARERDEAFEMLAVACLIDWRSPTPNQRGQLNAALVQIREASPDLSPHELAEVIEYNARAYRAVYEGMPVTPTALASHWGSVTAEYEKRRQPSTTYVVQDSDHCLTCNGDGLVLAGTRPVTGGVPGHDHFFEEYKPCPDCNQEAGIIAFDYMQRMKRIHGAAPPPPPPKEFQEFMAGLKGT